MPAKFNLLAAASIALVPLVPLLACGGSSSSPDAHIVTHDSNGSGSGSGSGSACSFAASLGTVTFTAQGGKYTAGSAASPANKLLFDGQLSNMDDIRVLLFGGCGTTGSNCGGSNNATPDWPTTFGAKSVDLSTAPDALVLGLADLSGQQYNTVYVSTAGTLNVTKAGNAAGSMFAATGTNVVLQHYDIGSASIMPDPDGCMTTITGFSMSGSAQFDGKTIVVYGPDRDTAFRNYLSQRWQ
jgi:hypothetical protein